MTPTRDGDDEAHDPEASRWLGRLSRAVAGAPRHSPLRLLAPLRSFVLGEMTKDDVVRVVRTVEEAGVRCWLAGGWGVDALLGHQTRRHDDVDLVIDDFDRQVGRAYAALEPLGFRVVSTQREPVWMPDRWELRDDARHGLDLLSLDWSKLRAALAVRDGAPEGVLESALSVGHIDGHQVPCLSSSARARAALWICPASCGWSRPQDPRGRRLATHSGSLVAGSPS